MCWDHGKLQGWRRNQARHPGWPQGKLVTWYHTAKLRMGHTSGGTWVCRILVRYDMLVNTATVTISIKC